VAFLEARPGEQALYARVAEFEKQLDAT
jgi:hypothetical protein